LLQRLTVFRLEDGDLRELTFVFSTMVVRRPQTGE
jgi:hypothetical protein